MKRISAEDKKTMKYFEAELKKLNTDTEAMFKPSKEDLKDEKEFRKLEKEITVLHSEHAKTIQKALKENTRGIRQEENMLEKDPTNKNAMKALQGLKKINSKLEKMQSS